MLLNYGVGEDSWQYLGLQGDPTSPSKRKSVLNIHWKDWCWSWNSNTLATWCEELTHWKRPWCLERLKAGGEGDDRGQDGWMASLAQWTWVWVNSAAGDGQGGLVCCSPWGRKESETIERLNWTELKFHLLPRNHLSVTLSGRLYKHLIFTPYCCDYIISFSLQEKHCEWNIRRVNITDEVTGMQRLLSYSPILTK